jgi:hypothetical protein
MGNTSFYERMKSSIYQSVSKPQTGEKNIIDLKLGGRLEIYDVLLPCLGF